MATAKEQHEEDVANKVPHHSAGGTDGGKCLTGHVGKSPEKGQNDSCAYRWQAYVKMTEDPGKYNWPAYKEYWRKHRSLIRTRSFGVGSIYPRGYATQLDAPARGAWDVKGNNFWTDWRIPYWHEAHHIVPKGTLGRAIADTAKDAGNAGLEITIRRGLAGEAYNINHKDNMIMLPQDEAVADVLGLPIHTKTTDPSDPASRHQAFSDKIYSELRKVFNRLIKRMEKHESRKYDSVKAEIEALSRTMYGKIQATPAGALDDMLPSEFPSLPV